MPLVSVIMTSYNYGQYISEAIDSVLDQTFADFELIVLDDGSRDDSRDIIRRHAEKDPRVRYVFHEKNRGIARTNNEGLRMSEGRFVAFMDSDDLWARDKLEKQVDVLQGDEDLIVWTDGYVINRDGKRLRKKAGDNIWRGSNLEKRAEMLARSEDFIIWSKLETIDGPGGLTFIGLFDAGDKKKSGDLFSELLQGNYILGSGLILKKANIGDIRFDPSLKYLNDYLFNLELAKKYCFHFIAEPLIAYRLHGRNSTLRDNLGWYRDRLWFNELILDRYGRDIPRKLKSRLMCINGMICTKVGQTGKAPGYLFRGIVQYPLHAYYVLILGCLAAKRLFRGGGQSESGPAPV